MELRLRDWTVDDQDRLVELVNNRNVSMFLTDGMPYPYTEEDAYEGIQFCVSSNKIDTLIKAIEIDGEAVGNVNLFVKQDIYRKTAECGIWLGEPYWGKGIGPVAMRELCKIGFHCLDIVRIYGSVMESNVRGQKMMKKAGFTHEGTMRKHGYKMGWSQDMLMYSILKEELD